MEILKSNELINIQGGAIKIGFVLSVISALITIIGIFDGFLRPLKCNVK